MRRNNNYLKKLAGQWIERSEEDLKSAEVELNETKNYTLVCFLCHQVIERYMKSFLMIHGIPIKDKVRTHELPYLLARCTKIQNDFGDWLEEVKFLNRFYIDTRYPSQLGYMIFSREDAERSIEYARAFKRFIKNLIPKGRRL